MRRMGVLAICLLLLAVILVFAFMFPPQSPQEPPVSADRTSLPDGQIIYPVTWSPMMPPPPGNPFFPPPKASLQ